MPDSVSFGWRVPDFPDWGQRPAEFREQIFHYMDTIQDGLTSAWVGDHFFPWPSEVDQSLMTIEAWTTLSFLMAQYPRMQMGSIVLSQGYRHPAALAKMAAVLQWLSQGRFILGIGAGWKENEYRAYGYDFPPAAERIEQLDEAVQLILAMWTEDCPTFHGKYYNVEEACCRPRPQPLPPILIGGGGRKHTLRIVAQFADWWNHPNSSPAEYASLLEALQGHCQEVGRGLDEIVLTWASDCVAIAPTREAAERIRDASPYAKYGPLVGTPDEIAAQLQPYVALGVEHFMLRFADFPGTAGVELFMKEVAPRFK